MSNFKAIIKSHISSWFTYHPVLKLISLILAVIVWFYAAGELKQFNY